jgi:small redox-active disulfide protein 2
MLDIKVIGPGCANCQRVEEYVRMALDEFKAGHPDISATIEKVSDPVLFLDYGIMTTPGLVINGKVVSAGRIPSPATIAEWLRQAVGV